MQKMPPLEGLAGGDVSTELTSTLRSIAEITAGDAPKYSAAVNRRLVRWIVCRSYSGPLRELCHLIVASDRAIGAGVGTQGYERVFWGTGAARARAFRAVFQDKSIAGVEPLGGGIRTVYADGEFGIAYTRMPFLSAMMEFLVSIFGYADLDAKFRAIPSAQVTKGAVDALANDLARQVYNYLSRHLPSAQAHRKFRAVIAFLRHLDGGSVDAAVGPHSIDDDVVLDFWITASNDPRHKAGSGYDFKSFKSVFRLMVSARDALAAAAQVSAMDYALPIGTDRSAMEIDPGTVSPDAVDTALSVIHERQAPLDVLMAAPADRVKFLKKIEMDAIAPIIEYGETALALPLSVLRLQVMGMLQGRLTEALRRGGDPLGLIHLDQLNSIPSGYGMFADDIGHISDNLQAALLASFHHLLAARREEAITVLLFLRPDMDLSPLASVFDDSNDESSTAGSDQVVHLKAPGTEDRFMRTLTAGLGQCPEFVALIGEAGNAAKRITRKGFKDSDWVADDNDRAGNKQFDRVDACAAASDSLIQIRNSLQKFTSLLQRLGRRHGGWERQFRMDCDIFFAQFRALYGDNR